MKWGELDNEIGEFRKEKRSAYWVTVEKTAIGKRALLVEGDDDKDVIEALLSSIVTEAEWSQHVHVAVVGSRDRVLKALEDHADAGWYGLVDRDTWDAAEVAARTKDQPTLAVTEGWCLENHFCNFGELEAALGVNTGDLASHHGNLDAWLRYEAIRWTLQRIGDDFRKTQPSARWGHPSKGPFDDSALRALLKDVYKMLPDDVFAEFIRRQQEVTTMLPRQRVEVGIHGKELFREVVVPALNRALGQREANIWRIKVATAWKGRWPVYLTNLAQTLISRR